MSGPFLVSCRDVKRRSGQQPADVFITPGINFWIAGNPVSATFKHRLILLALLSRGGRSMPLSEIVGVLYADRPDGGPDYADECARRCMMHVKALAQRLGVRVESRYVFGYSAIVPSSDKAEAA